MTKKDICIFCNLDQIELIEKNSLSMAFYDKNPVTKGHTLIIPVTHRKDYFDLHEDELLSMNSMLKNMRQRLMSEDPTIEGFNIGMNCGEVSGQTIFHCHIHLIPRRRGDVQNPRGGVRGVINEKQKY